MMANDIKNISKACSIYQVAPKEWSSNPIFVDLPLMDQMGYTAVLTAIVIVVVSISQNKGADDQKAIPLSKALFKTSPGFNIGSFAIMIILVALYSLLWN
jgi:SSS family solute:Na+ symporter